MKKVIVTMALLAVCVLAMTGCGKKKERLKLFLPGEYLGENVISDFEKEFNCEVIVENFDSNEAMYTKLQAGDKYDVLIPSDYTIERLLKEDYLQKLDKAVITQRSNPQSGQTETFLNGETLRLSELSEGVAIIFRADTLGRCFLAVTILLYTSVLFYSFEYMKMEERIPTFYAFYLISMGALIAECFAGNLVTMYLSFEFLTLTSMPLVLHERTKEAVAAGLKYLFYSVAGAMMGMAVSWIRQNIPALRRSFWRLFWQALSALALKRVCTLFTDGSRLRTLSRRLPPPRFCPP